MNKFEIVNALGRTRNVQRYLEICTPSTGVEYAKIDRKQFSTTHRMMYRCPVEFDDGFDITFRTSADTSDELTKAIYAQRSGGGEYDIIFVDSWHTYVASFSDLQGAVRLLRKGGIIVVADCSPAGVALVNEEYQAGSWCGATYKAFIDFVLSTGPAGYFVIDGDHGCGVICTSPDALPAGIPTGLPDRRLTSEWNAVRATPGRVYSFFNRYRTQLLNLVPGDALTRALGLAEHSTDVSLMQAAE